MRMPMKILAALAAIMLVPAAALAQSSPGLIYGQVPTAAQWNSYFAAKQDVLGYTPVNKAGDVMLGPLITAPSNTSLAGFNLAPGAAPTTPQNGDTWTTSAGLFVQINGATVGPLVSAASCSICAFTNAANTFTVAPQTLSVNQNASTSWIVSNTTSGTSALAAFGASTASGGGSFGAGSAGLSTAILAGRIFVNAGSTALVLNTATTQPLIIGYNNGEVARFQNGLSIGTTTDPGAGRLSIDANSVAPLSTGGNAGFQITSANATLASIYQDVYGASATLVFRRLDGTGASPTGVVANDVMGTVVANGWTSSAAFGGGPSIRFTAVDTYTNTANGSMIQFLTIPTGTTTLTEIMRLQASGGMSLGNGAVGTDMGGGGIINSANSTAVPAISITAATNYSLTVSANSVFGFDSIVSFANGAGYVVARSDGTAASKSALASSDLIGGYYGAGWDGANWITAGRLLFTANQAWSSGTAAGTYASIFTTPNGSETATEMARFQASGGVSFGSANVSTDPGSGGILATLVTVSGTSASALAVGAAGATNPAFDVDASTASSVTGIKVKSAASGGNVAISVTSTATNENLVISPKGTGFAQFGGAVRSSGSGGVVNGFIFNTAASGSPPEIQSNDLGGTGDTNIDFQITPKGTGVIKTGNAGSFTANGAVATALTSVGPTGSHTTVQEWLTVKDSAGTVRYIPAF
jgi:hypothetical protein